jgi:predicted dehydrogenase
MVPSTRRRFLAATTGLSVSLLAASSLRAAGANQRVRVAILGAGNQGRRHAESLQSLANVEIAAVSDVDAERLAAQHQRVGSRSQAVADFRRILDDRSIDAVTIALPDHWHTPAALLAIAAGKHVYVEKPCSHNVREGRRLVAAAAQSQLAVAHGTQSRATPGLIEAIAMLRDGAIGKVLVAKCWNYQQRDDIGRRQPTSPPATVDYDAWVGPAEWLPFQENRFHYDWHWWRNFGTGDAGNDGCHELDLALWGLGVDEHPATIAAVGGKYHFNDDQQFPDTLQATFEWPGSGAPGERRMLIYEQRLWTTNYPHNVDSGVEFLGDAGRMFLSKRGKFELHGPRNARSDRKLAGAVAARVEENHQDWLNVIRDGGVPRANIEAAHRTATLAHLGNIAAQLGRSLQFDPQAETISADAEANALLARRYRADGHWAIPAQA